MNINLRFLYLLPLLAVLATTESFAEFVFSSLIKQPDVVPAGLEQYKLLLLAASGGMALYCYRSMEPLMRRWLLALALALGVLALESYASWNKWLVYPHVFAKLLILLPVFGVYGFYRRFGLPPVGLLAGGLLALVLANLVLCHPEALSLSAFLHNVRGVGAATPMLLVLVALYYLNTYLTKGGLSRLLACGLGLGLVVFLQHRTVWMALTGALTLNVTLLLLGRVAGARLSAARLLPLLLLPVGVLLSGGLAAVADPRVMRRLEASLADIQHADKQGTGSWRIGQFKAYQPFVEAHPVGGMRFEGFELPVQFYQLAPDGGSEVPVWHSRTGHHFHSFYLDRLFYFGLAGLLLTLLVPVQLLGRRLLRGEPLTPAAATGAVFALSLLVYGFSYDWPLYFYGLLGLALAQAAASGPVAGSRPAKRPELLSDEEPADTLSVPLAPPSLVAH